MRTGDAGYAMRNEEAGHEMQDSIFYKASRAVGVSEKRFWIGNAIHSPFQQHERRETIHGLPPRVQSDIFHSSSPITWGHEVLTELAFGSRGLRDSIICDAFPKRYSEFWVRIRHKNSI
jgi:hypothetical protein